MMKTIITGIMEGSLPWGHILVGVCIAIVIELIGIPVLPFAIGLYLPIGLNACIMVGGIIRLFFDRMKNKEKKDAAINKGILYCSGLIAGEGIMGLALAVLAVVTVNGTTIADRINLSGLIENQQTANLVFTVAGGVILAAIVASVVGFSLKKEKGSQQSEENQ